MMEVLEQIRATKIVPTIVLDDAKDAAPLAHAMAAGNLPLAEITFRTEAAPAAIREMANTGKVLVGAGTVTTVQQVEQAHASGARFIVSPGTNVNVIRRSLELGLAVIPGAATPSEIMTVLEQGLTTVKFFPASVFGGTKAIRALSGPFPQASFVPTGGVSAANLKDYLDLPAVAAVGGSWMVPRSSIAAGNFDEIAALCAEAVTAAN